MDRRLENELARRRAQSCPPRVLAEVRAGLRRPRTVLLRLAFGSMAVGALVVLAIIKTGSPDAVNTTPIVAQSTGDESPDSAQAAREMYAALALFGRTLIEAGEESGRVIFRKTQTSLEKGWDNINETIDQTRK